MHVIVLNDYGYSNGGAAQVAISSLNALAKTGLDVTFVSSVGPADPSIHQDLVKTVNFGFHDLLRNPSRLHASIRGIWDTRCADRLREVLADLNPADTIIHLHSWSQSLSSSVVRLANEMGVGIVCTLHDYFSVCPNGGLYNFQQQKQCQLQPMSIACLCSNCDSRSYAQKSWRVLRQAVQSKFGGIPAGIRYFITVSDYSEAILRPLLPSSSRIFHVTNPIDVSQHPPADVGKNSNFIFVGRLSPEKGATLFADAAQRAGVNAVFVGSGPEAANIAQTNPSAELCGWQDRSQVMHSIQSSRALVFPSLWHETQGMVVLEAAALGVPAIVSDACAARDAIVDGETGLLFRSGDKTDLTAKLTHLQNNSSLAAALGHRSYERYWSAPCTPAAHVKQLIACYEEILSSDARR